MLKTLGFQGTGLPFQIPPQYSTLGLSYEWGCLLPRTAQRSALPKSLTHFSRRASGVGQSDNSGSQLLAPISQASLHLDPEAFRSPGGRAASCPCYRNQPQTPQKENLPKRPPIDPFPPGIPKTPSIRSLPGATCLSPGPCSRGLFRRATPKNLLRLRTP